VANYSLNINPLLHDKNRIGRCGIAMIESQICARVEPFQVIELATSGLSQMFDQERRLFSYTMRHRNGKLVSLGVSHRYTMMTILGLYRFEQSGGESPVPVSAALDQLTADLRWVKGAGDLGLLLWACALIDPSHLVSILELSQFDRALIRYPDARRFSTMELAWFLTGLAYSMEKMPSLTPKVGEMARVVYRMLCVNQGVGGIFGHMSTRHSLSGLLRGRIGSFADQVYPIYAFSQFAIATGDDEARSRALQCARSICRCQGEQGEWWWHYDSRSGEISETYPVYSVHQDGMAPMALYKVAQATGVDFTAPIHKGLAWISGCNDLRFDMRDESARLIWRNFYLPTPVRYARHLLGSADNPRADLAHRLRVNYECRSYELGWLLYALAGRDLGGGLPRS
jgi:hypothetical protein